MGARFPATGLAVAHIAGSGHGGTHGGSAGSGDLLSILALIVSVLSLGAATLVGYLQYRSQARLTEIEQARRIDEVNLKNEELHRARSAAITATWQASAPVPALIVHNHGPAPAADVAIEISSAVPGRPPPSPQSGGSHLALKQLGSGESYAFLMTAPYGMAKAIEADVRWQDGLGSHHEAVPLSTA